MMQYELRQNDESTPDLEGWNVEAFDPDGTCLLAVFFGPAAKERAEEYAASMNADQHAWEIVTTGSTTG